MPDRRLLSGTIGGMQAPALPNLKIIWIALFNSILIYLAFCWFFPSEEMANDLETAVRNPTVTLLYGMSLVSFIASFLLFNQMTASQRHSHPTHDDQRRAASAPLVRAFLVRWALLEVITIFGLIAAFLSHSREVIVPAFILSAIGFFLSFPSDRLIADTQG